MKNKCNKFPKRKHFSFSTIIPIGTVSALYFIVARFIHIPSSFPDIEIPLHYAILASFAISFGSIPGAITGFFGQLLVCLCHETHFMVSTLITSTSIGFITGLFKKYSNAKNCFLELKDYFIFSLATLITQLTSLFIIRPLVFLLIQRHIAKEYLVIALAYFIVNVLTTILLGSVIGFLFAFVFKNYKTENL